MVIELVQESIAQFFGEVMETVGAIESGTGLSMFTCIVVVFQIFLAKSIASA